MSNEPIAYLRDLQPEAEDEALAVCWKGDPGAFPVYAANSSEQRSNHVGIGMAISAGIILSFWGGEIQAEEILGAAGLTTVKAMRDCGVETYDIRLCAPVLRTFRERAQAKASRTALREGLEQQGGVE